jgi:hypothetical protein
MAPLGLLCARVPVARTAEVQRDVCGPPRMPVRLALVGGRAIKGERRRAPVELASPMKPPEPVYEPRLILFLDILGFREIVADTAKNPDALRSLLAAIDVISEFSDDPDEGKQVSQFSDSIVVSYALTKQSAVFHLVNDVALTIIQLAARGFLLRGAITAGPLIHTERYLVGPAMVRAYEMESKEAVYPRVLIDPIVLEIAKRYRSPDHSAEDEAEYVRAFMSEDPTDGRWFCRVKGRPS